MKDRRRGRQAKIEQGVIIEKKKKRKDEIEGKPKDEAIKRAREGLRRRRIRLCYRVGEAGRQAGSEVGQANV